MQEVRQVARKHETKQHLQSTPEDLERENSPEEIQLHQDQLNNHKNPRIIQRMETRMEE